MNEFEKSFADQCELSIRKFQSILPVPWRPRSILLSEAFAVCAMCDLYRVDSLVESGIWEGRSTMIWGQYLRKVMAIDLTIRPGVLDRLTDCDITVAEGDAKDLVPLAVALELDIIGIFLDGPKGADAIELGKSCLRNLRVQFVAVHDMHKMSFSEVNESRTLADNEGFQFFTDAEWFVERYKWLDEDESQHDEEQDLIWVPGELLTGEGKPRRELGSYGPTIGFLIADARGLL